MASAIAIGFFLTAAAACSSAALGGALPMVVVADAAAQPAIFRSTVTEAAHPTTSHDRTATRRPIATRLITGPYQSPDVSQNALTPRVALAERRFCTRSQATRARSLRREVVAPTGRPFFRDTR